MIPVSKWCVVTDTPVPALEGLASHADLGGLHVYHRGPAETQLPPEAPFLFDVATLGLLAPGTPTAAPCTLHVAPDAVTARTSPLNENPVYYATNRIKGRFAYFTDLMVAPLVLPALGLPVTLTDLPGPDHATPLAGVARLRHGTVVRTRYRRGHWLTETADEPDPLGGFHSPHRNDPAAAGEAQLDALTAEISRIDALRPTGTGYATLLSGGIDSGTVTHLAATAGLDVTPYSVATPWGDELDDAAELCGELGIGLEAVHLTEDDIVASLPEAVRWLGVTDPEVVEVALTATTVQRLGAVPAERVLLTGYGSDLINAGLYRPFDAREELIDQVLGAVDRTRRSNELSNRMPLAYGTVVHHPFWSWPVMRVALETAPECKVREGREKYHLRTAMGRRVAEPIAWRKKIAVHHGGGLQDGVARRLQRDTGTTDRGAVYRAVFAELVSLASRGELEPADPVAVLDRAVARVRGR